MKELNLFLVFLFIILSSIFIFVGKRQHHWKILVIASLLFYYLLVGNKMVIALLMAGVVYGMSYAIERHYSKSWMAVLLLLIPLVLYKISSATGNHFQNYNDYDDIPALEWYHWRSLFKILGISYFTFNAISYLIDLERRYVTREKNFFKLLLYLLYFPAVFSGPLHRAKYLFGQFNAISITDRSVARGLRLMLWGLFKNIVIAQRLYILLNIYIRSELSGVWYLLVGLLFFLYLYCNFSSFIDFFRGVSALFNIELKENFRNRVYLSSSRQDFWKGWHITLNEWFRDYFFFVLFKYDKKKKYADYILLITFLCIAFWHELSFVMLLWGTCNGLWIILEKKVNFQKWRYPAFRKVAGVFYHLSVASLLALIFITPNPAIIVQKIVIAPSTFPVALIEQNLFKIAVIVVAFLIMDYHSSRAKDMDIDKYLETKSALSRRLFYLKLSLLILLFGVNPGIDNYYVQF